MQILKEETGPFEMWYQERQSTQNLATNHNLIKDVTHDFVNVSTIESISIPPTIEASITKNEQINSSKITTLTESMVNKALESIAKFEKNNDDEIAKITNSMLEKTKERLTKYEVNNISTNWL